MGNSTLVRERRAFWCRAVDGVIEDMNDDKAVMQPIQLLRSATTALLQAVREGGHEHNPETWHRVVTPLERYETTGQKPDRGSVERAIEAEKAAWRTLDLAMGVPCSVSIGVTPHWDKETHTLTYKSKAKTHRSDATTAAEAFQWFESEGWPREVRIQGHDIIEHIEQVNHIVERANQKARKVGFKITRKGAILKWADISPPADT